MIGERLTATAAQLGLRVVWAADLDVDYVIGDDVLVVRAGMASAAHVALARCLEIVRPPLTHPYSYV